MNWTEQKSVFETDNCSGGWSTRTPRWSILLRICWKPLMTGSKRGPADCLMLMGPMWFWSPMEHLTSCWSQRVFRVKLQLCLIYGPECLVPKLHQLSRRSERITRWGHGASVCVVTRTSRSVRSLDEQTLALAWPSSLTFSISGPATLPRSGSSNRPVL